MSTLELAVLIGSVLLVAIVWMIPLSRDDAPASRATSDQREPAATAGETAATPIQIPVAIETAIVPGVADEFKPIGELAMPLVTPAPAVSAMAAASVHEPVYFRGATTSTARFSTSFDRLSETNGHFAQNGNGSITTSATPSTGGGAASHSSYPLAIAIPIAMSVAPPPEPTPTHDPIIAGPTAAVAEPAQPISDVTEPLAEPIPVPVRSTTLFEDSSAAAPSVTWSASPSADPASPSSLQAWTGSQSVVARVSGVELRGQNETARRRLLLAGAGLVLAVAVATRH